MEQSISNPSYAVYLFSTNSGPYFAPWVPNLKDRENTSNYDADISVQMKNLEAVPYDEGLDLNSIGFIGFEFRRFGKEDLPGLRS